MIARRTLVIAVLTTTGGNWAWASRPRINLEQVDASHCRTKQQLKAYISEVELDGRLRFRSPTEYRLVLDGRLLRQPPSQATRFSRSGTPLHVVLLLEVGPPYEHDLSRIRTAAASFIGLLPPRSRINVMTYTWEVTRLALDARPHRAVQALENMSADTSEVDLALVDALRTALRVLGKAAPTSRRVVVVVSDGLNRDPDRELFREVGRHAASLSIPIFPIAYSPVDDRGPLLNLGEIAKRSRGTLRWARDTEDLEPAFSSLARQIDEHLVLTFAIHGCDQRHRIAVAAGALRSTELLVEPQASSAQTANGATKGEQPSTRWWLLAVLLLAGAAALAGLAHWVSKAHRPSKDSASDK